MVIVVQVSCMLNLAQLKRQTAGKIKDAGMVKVFIIDGHRAYLSQFIFPFGENQYYY